MEWGNKDKEMQQLNLLDVDHDIASLWYMTNYAAGQSTTL